MSKFTRWFSPSENPSRKGVYQIDGGTDFLFSYWNGKRWGSTSFFPGNAELFGKIKHYRQLLYWRGLAKEPA